MSLLICEMSLLPIYVEYTPLSTSIPPIWIWRIVATSQWWRYHIQVLVILLEYHEKVDLFH